MKNETPQVYVIGLGYVGLTLAVTLAKAGLKVTGIDQSKEIVDSLRNGNSHFFEEELDVTVHEVIRNGTLSVSTSLTRASDAPAAFVISVGTPVDPLTKKPVLTQIDGSIESLAPSLRKGDLVILRSTVPVGTSAGHVLKTLVQKTGLAAGEDLFFAFAPERTVEGKAMHELKSLPQIIGGHDEESARKAAALFASYNNDIVIVPDLEHAEMLKVFDNSYRDVIFAYANQMALICERIGLNYSLIRDVANHNYPRNNIAMSSPGVGGACLTKDPYLLIDICKKHAINHQLISAGREINEYVAIYLANQVVSELTLNKIDPATAKIFVLGIAFKGQPATSDTRFSPTLDFVEAVRERVPNVWGFDPHLKSNGAGFNGLKLCEMREGLAGADAIVIMTNHLLWKSIDLDDCRNKVGRPCLVFDHWNMLHDKRPDDPIFRFRGFGMAQLYPSYPIKFSS